MKNFSVAFFVKKKMVNHFSESLTFASAMIYQNEVRKKHPRMLIFYGAMDNQERDLESIFSSTLVTCFSDRSPSGDASIVLLCYFCTFRRKMVMIIWCLAMDKNPQNNNNSFSSPVFCMISSFARKDLAFNHFRVFIDSNKFHTSQEVHRHHFDYIYKQML